METRMAIMDVNGSHIAKSEGEKSLPTTRMRVSQQQHYTRSGPLKGSQHSLLWPASAIFSGMSPFVTAALVEAALSFLQSSTSRDGMFSGLEFLSRALC
jgi:hypothetical protein